MNPKANDRYNSISLTANPASQQIELQPTSFRFMSFQASPYQSLEPYYQQSTPPHYYQATSIELAGQPIKAEYKKQLIWAITNTILFFPLFCLWPFALYHATKAKAAYLHSAVISNKFAEKARHYNIPCTVFGNFF